VDVLVRPEVAVDFARLTRHVFASSSCGVCGSATIEAVAGVFAKVAGAEGGAGEAGPFVAEGALWEMLAALRASQPTFDKTGGLHAAGLFEIGGDGRATLIAAREDVGRHNAVDKVVGFAFKAGMLPLSRHVLLVSGRVSFEIVQKALAAGVPVVAAVSAPSSLAIDLAEESGVTLIGFLRGGEAGKPGRFNVYTHAGRVRG
jgi:FdhD protein